MSEAFVVEVWGQQVGLAIRERGGFRFFAAAPGYFALDGKLFPSYGQARLAAIRKAKSATPVRPAPGETTLPA